MERASGEVSVCFVCLGNICRSPTAEGVMRHVLQHEGLSDAVHVDSAGTAAYHAGEAPDRRSTAAAKRRGVVLSGRARQFRREDWQRFDLILAMDRENFADLEATRPTDARGRLVLFRDFDDQAPPGAEVPDPYYGGERGFDEVLDICERACRGLLAHLRAAHGV